MSLILEINALHAVAYTRQHLVRDCFEYIGKHRNGQVVAEDFDRIALLTVYSRNVNHCHIHADIAHIISRFTVYETIAVAVSQMTVQSVGVADRYRGYHTVAFYLSLARISHRVARRNVTQLQYGSLQSAYIIYYTVIRRIHSIESDAEPAHIHLALGEMLYAC